MMEPENKGIMQGIAIGVEMALRHEYKCERHGLGGIADSDYIRNYKGAFHYCMIIILFKYYSNSNSNLIDGFIEKISQIKEIKMDELENKKAEKIYDDFQNIYKKVGKAA